MNIIEYRALESAKRQHNADTSKMSEGQVALWMEMIAAANDDDDA